MKEANKDFLDYIDQTAESLKNKILTAKDNIKTSGTCYYVSNDGNDNNDGLTPNTSWATLDKVSNFSFKSGDAVKFKRGDIFRGRILTKSNVTYCAYGNGDKPKMFGWTKNLCDASLWELVDNENNIYKYVEDIPDVGTLVFNDGELVSRKLIPSYIGGKFVCRDNPSKAFVMAEQMTENLDIFCFYNKRFTTETSKGENFPVPLIDEESYGQLYLRCDGGNPANMFNSIEAIPKRSMFYVADNQNVTIDNFCIKYMGIHAVSGIGQVNGLHVSNCEIGWIGGSIQNYLGNDPNYPQGPRGSVTRFGNGIEIYGGCNDYIVENCYIYQIYDAGITHQITTFGKKWTMENIKYSNNLLENCVYSIEYFLEKNQNDTESYMNNIEICENIFRFGGYGWGQQRHNTHTPALIKGWSYENTAYNYCIHHNIYDRCAYRLVHLICKEKECLPIMHDNTYIQKYGLTLGQYGENKLSEPPILAFFDNAEDIITNSWNDKNSKVYYIK